MNKKYLNLVFTYITLHVNLKILNSYTVQSCSSKVCIVRNTRHIINILDCDFKVWNDWFGFSCGCMNLVDPTLETRVDLLNSCFDDFYEKSSKPETSSGFTSSLSEINESG